MINMWYGCRSTALYTYQKAFDTGIVYKFAAAKVS